MSKQNEHSPGRHTSDNHSTRKCQDFASARLMPRFLWLCDLQTRSKSSHQRWLSATASKVVVVCVGSRAPTRKCILSPRAIEDIEKKHRHRRPDGYPQTCETVSPRIPVRSRAFESSANSTCRHPTRTLLGGACLQMSGKRGRIWVNSARRAPDHDDHFQPTYSSPSRSPTSLNLAQP